MTRSWVRLTPMQPRQRSSDSESVIVSSSPIRPSSSSKTSARSFLLLLLLFLFVPNQRLLKETENGLTKIQAFLTVIRMLFHNRARQHRLSSFVFQELNQLMQHTRAIDFSIFQQPVLFADLPEPPVHPINLSTWVLNIITQLMTHFFELGFELELFRPDDLMMVYWSLSHFSFFFFRFSDLTFLCVLVG